MENKTLKNRLFLNLVQKTSKPTYMLEQNPDSPAQILKPKVLQDNTFHANRTPQTFFNQGKFSLSMKEKQMTKIIKPKEIHGQKLSKEAKSIIDQGKGKFKSNLKPKDIFSFYDTFPEMIEDFFYLNRIDNPYDYQIVSYAKRNPIQYMTISSQGITLYHQKEAQFLTREEWIQDEKIYHKLQKIDFFNQYKISKNFGIWKNRMKRHYMKQMSNILDERLFLAYPHPRKCLLDIRLASLRLKESLNMMPSNLIEPIQWRQLIDLSGQFQEKDLLIKISEIQKNIIQSLEIAIEEEIKNFKISNNIKIEGLNAKQGNKEGYVYSQEAILRKQYKRIIKLIRLGQNILLQSKIELFQRFLEEIVQKMKEVSEESLKEDWLVIIFTAVPSLFSETQIDWTPSDKDFISTFKVIINKVVQVVCEKHEKILNHPVFQKYKTTEDNGINNREDKHNNFKLLIEGSPSYSELMRSIQQYLEIQYQHVIKEEENLMKFLKIYAKHKNLDKMEDILKNNSAIELQQFVREWQQDHIAMEDLPDKEVGILKFDFSILRKKMIHVPGESLANLFNLLPSHLNDKCHYTAKKTKKLLESINIIPNDSTFVEFNKAVKIAVDMLDEIIDEGSEIKQILHLLETNRRPNLEIHKANMKDVIAIINQLKGKVDDANGKYDQRLSKFKKDIEVTISKIKGNAKDLNTKFEAINFDNAESEITEILMKISSVLPQINDMEKQITKIQSIEIELSLKETNFDEARNLHKNAQLISELWTCKKEWKQLMTIIKREHYSKIDCEDLTEKWELFTNRSNIIKLALPDSAVLTRLIEDINSFENLMDLVRALQSKSINVKSWKQISEYLAYEIDKTQDGDQKNYPFYDHNSPEYTLDWLIENNICLYKEKIKFIVKKSEKQTELTNVLAVLKAYISSLAIEFVTKKRDIILLKENKIFFNELNNHISQINEILDQDYSENIKKEAKNLLKHYEYVSQVLGAYWEFGKYWNRYEGLFDSTRTFSKLLNKESKDFINWEIGWKKITKNIMLQNWSKKIVEQTNGLHPSRTTMKQINKINATIEQIKRGIQDFCDKKRSSFWRYFFFSDEELISILIKIDIQQIQEAVPLFYEGIKQINIDREKDLLISVKSKDGEQLKIGKLVTSKLLSQPQQILKTCEQQWKKSLISTIKKVFNDFISPSEEQISRTKIMKDNVTQVVLAVDHIIWVRLAEETYLCDEPVGTLGDWIQIQEYQIRQIFSLLKEEEECAWVQKKKYYQLLTQSVFERQKTEYLKNKKIDSLNSYEWQRTLKLCDGRGNMHQKIYMKQLSAMVYYGGQFMGCRDLSFIAPESEKVYLSLNQAISQRQITFLTGDKNRITLLTQLSYLVAQPFQQFDFSSFLSEKSLDKLFCASCMNGGWMCFNLPSEIQIVSIIASHITQIRKILQQGNYNTQLGKYTIQINQLSPPNFFLNFPTIRESSPQTFRKIHQWRIINFMKPDLKKIMEVKSFCSGENIEIGAIIAEIVDYCSKMFSNDLYLNFSLSFAKDIFQKYQQKIAPSKNIRQKISQITLDLLKPHLKQKDKYLLNHFFECFEEQNLIKKQKTLIKKKSILNPHRLDSYIVKISDEKEIVNEKYAKALYDIILSQKQCILSGSALSGKSHLIKFVSEAYQFMNLCQLPEVTKIYHKAHKKQQIFKIIAKALSSPTNRKKWIVFDGPLNQVYLQAFCEESEKIVIQNYGVLNKKGDQSKFFLQTSDLSNIPPSIVSNHSIIHLENGSTNELISVIIRNELTQPLYKVYEENFKSGKCEQNKVDIKIMEVGWKKVNLGGQTLNYLIDQLISSIHKVTTEGRLKIRSIETLYTVSILQIAYRCAKLVKSIFKMNWETIKESEKNLRKNIDKFVLWVIVWTLINFIAPEDFAKLQKQIMEILKLTYIFPEGIQKYVVYPGAGLQIHPIRSVRAQSTLPNIPSLGVPTNILMYSNFLQENNQTVKNKFYEEIYLDQPYLVRINTDDSAIFSYMTLLNSFIQNSVMVYGQSGTGKKSLLDLYIKNNQEKEQLYSIRLKKHDNYYISKQIAKPFSKVNGLSGSFHKPSQNYRKLHVLIEDVNLTSRNYSTVQYLRMIINEKGVFNEDGTWISFTQSNFTMILNELDLNNLQKVSFHRMLSKISLMRTSLNTKEKLISIFGPITQTWGNSIWESSESQELRLFSSQNGDSIIDASVNVFMEMQEYLNGLGIQNSEERIKQLTMKPKIGDLCLMITNICQLEEPQKNYMKDFAELWAHEVLRVFGDKSSDDEWLQILRKEVKKQLLLKFKQNFTVPQNFIYSDLNRQVYEKCQNLEQICEDVHTILNEGGYKIPFSFLFDDFIREMLKVYRIIGLTNGHIFMINYDPTVVKYLAKIASFIKEAALYDIKGRKISSENHMIPTIINEIQTCFFYKIQDMSSESLYQISCLLNRNYDDLEVGTQTLQKMKNYFFSIAQQSYKENTKISGESLAKKILNQGQNQENIWSIVMKKKIQDKIQNLISEAFCQNMHIVIAGNINSSSLRVFFSNYSSILKHMHVNFCSIKQASIEKAIKSVIDCEVALNKEICQKCCLIFDSLGQNKKNLYSYYSLVQQIIEKAEKLDKRLSKNIQELEKCLQFMNNIQSKIEQGKEKQQRVQKDIQELIQKQSLIKQKGQQNLEDAEILRQLKVERERLQQNCRQMRNTQTIHQNLLKQIPSKAERIQTINKLKGQKSQLINEVILVQFLITFYPNGQTKEEYIEIIKSWSVALEYQHQIKSIGQLLNLLERVLGKEYVKIEKWKQYSDFIKLQGILFAYTYIQRMNCLEDFEVIKVYDENELFEQMLSQIDENEPYHACKFLKRFNSEESEKNKKQKALTKKQVLSHIEKELYKYRSGVVLVEEEGELKMNESDFEKELRSLYQKKQTEGNRIILMTNQKNSNFELRVDSKELYNRLCKKSIELEYGEASLMEKKILQSKINEYSIKIDKKKQQLVENCLNEELESEVPRMLQKVQKINESICQMNEQIKKARQNLKGQRFMIQDEFIINWILSFVQKQKGDKILISLLFNIYETIKKQLIIMNSEIGETQQKVHTLQQISTQVLLNWQKYIQINILQEQNVPFLDYVNYIIPANPFPPFIVMDDFHENLNYILQQLGIIKFHYRIYDCLGSIQTLINSSVGMESSSHDNDKKIYILHNFFTSKSNHRSLFHDIVNKYKETERVLFIIMSDEPKKMKDQSFLLGKPIKLVYKSISTQLFKPYAYNFQNQSKTLLLQPPINKIISMTAKSSSLIESQNEVIQNQCSEEGQKVVKKIIQKFMTFFKAWKVQLRIENGESEVSYREDMEILGKKNSLLSNTKYIYKSEQARSLLKDFLDEGQSEWMEVISLFIESVVQESDEKILKYEEALEKKKVENKKKKKKEEIEMFKEVENCIEKDKIEELIKCLPFAFNLSQFIETFEPLLCWFVQKAQEYNHHRSHLKHYLQNIIKIISGCQPNPLGNKLILPTQNLFEELTQTYEGIKKGLEFFNIIPSHEINPANYKMISSNQPNSSTAPIIASAFNSKNVRGITSKQLIMVTIKACKKLKLSYNKIKTVWKLCTKNTVVEEPITNPELCFVLKGEVVRNSNLFNTSQNVKFLFCPYSSLAVSQLPINASQKPLNNKKENKKNKQDITKTVRNSIVGINQVEIPIRNQYSIEVIGNVLVDVKNQSIAKLQEPEVRLH